MLVTEKVIIERKNQIHVNLHLQTPEVLSLAILQDILPFGPWHSEWIYVNSDTITALSTSWTARRVLGLKDVGSNNISTNCITRVFGWEKPKSRKDQSSMPLLKLAIIARMETIKHFRIFPVFTTSLSFFIIDYLF